MAEISGLQKADCNRDNLVKYLCSNQVDFVSGNCHKRKAIVHNLAFPEWA